MTLKFIRDIIAEITHLKWTLKRLNLFKDYERCIPISYHSGILNLVQLKKTRFQLPDLQCIHFACIHVAYIQYCQYHSCWCPGDLRSQGISRHGIDQINWNILSLVSEELILHFSGSNELTQHAYNTAQLGYFWPRIHTTQVGLDTCSPTSIQMVIGGHKKAFHQGPISLTILHHNSGFLFTMSPTGKCLKNKGRDLENRMCQVPI